MKFIIINQINNEIKDLANRPFFDFNNINKDFELLNIRKNNISIKKLFKFEVKDDEIDIIRDRKLLKLNANKNPACFICSYTKRNNNINSSYIDVYDNNLNLLFSKLVYSKRIHEIIQLKDNSLLLITYKKILIIKIDINNKTFEVIQEFEKKSKYYFETLLDNDNISLLIPMNTKNHFFLKYNNKINNNNYFSYKVSIFPPISNDNTYFIDNYNFINLNNRKILFYNINCNYNNSENNYNIEIINNKVIEAKSYLNNGIYFINKDIFVICGIDILFLVSFTYKEIISKILYYNIDKIYRGFSNECYIGLSAWVSRHKILRQIHFNENNEIEGKEKGEIIVEGNTYLEGFDFYNKYSLIDIGDIICYIKANQKEENEIEYGSQYLKE